MTLPLPARRLLVLAAAGVLLFAAAARGEGISVGTDPDDVTSPPPTPAAAPAENHASKDVKSEHHHRRSDKSEKAEKSETEKSEPSEHGETRTQPRNEIRPPVAEKPAEPAPAPSTPSDLGAVGAAPGSLPQNAVTLPTDSWSTLVDHWQRREQSLSRNEPKGVEEEEHEVYRIKHDLALENLLTPSAALLQEADNALRKDRAQDAVARCDEAVQLSPDLNLAWLCKARASFQNSFLDLRPVFSSLSTALSVTLKDPRSRRSAVADWTLLLLLGFALGCGGLLLFLMVRYATLFTHDFNHLFPQGVSQWQTLIVALALLALPALLGAGLLGVVVLAAIGISFSLSRGEAIALAIAFVLLAGAQYMAGAVLEASAFGRTAQDVYLLERGDAPDAAAARLESRHDKGLGQYATAYALGHYHKRLGQLTVARDDYDAARKLHDTPELLNNVGNVLFLMGDTDGARAKYNESQSRNPSLAAPLWNLAKLYFREGKLEQGQKAINQARAIETDPDRIKDWSSPELKANTYLVDVSLTDAEIGRLADEESASIVNGSGALFPMLTGRAGMGVAVALALLAASFIVAGQFLKRRVHASTHCEKCGRAVCSRCDPEVGDGSELCGQCISVFVRRSGVDAPDRIRKEVEVRQFRRRRRLVVRAIGILVGGGGHVLAGRVVGGVIFLTAFGLLLAQVIFPHGIIRSPVPLRLSVSTFYIVLYVIGFACIYGASLFHLVRHEEAD